MNHCNQTLVYLSMQQDEQLTQSQQEWLKTHLATCQDCRETADAFAQMANELQSLASPNVPAGFSASVMQAIREHDVKEMPTIDVMQKTAVRRKSAYRSWLVAAMLALVVGLGLFVTQFPSNDMADMALEMPAPTLYAAPEAAMFDEMVFEEFESLDGLAHNRMVEDSNFILRTEAAAEAQADADDESSPLYQYLTGLHWSFDTLRADLQLSGIGYIQTEQGLVVLDPAYAGAYLYVAVEIDETGEKQLTHIGYYRAGRRVEIRFIADAALYYIDVPQPMQGGMQVVYHHELLQFVGG